jgi:ribosomal protein L5
MLLKEKFKKDLAPQLMKDLELKNPILLPRLEKEILSFTTTQFTFRTSIPCHKISP